MRKNLKKSKIRIASVLVAIAVSGAILVGCSSKSKDEKKDNEDVSYNVVLGEDIINDIESDLVSHEENIKNLEEKLNNATSQSDMNQISAEISQAWNDFLDSLLNTIKENVGKEAWKQYEKEQNEWIKTKDTAVKEAGAKFEGGTMQPLEENSTAASLTKERVYDIIEKLKEENK